MTPPVDSGYYRRAPNFPTGTDCPLCQITVVGLWHKVGPDQLSMCDECHTSWERKQGMGRRASR
jgi:hypothetical protein